jgi:hypothetical protein
MIEIDIFGSPSFFYCKYFFKKFIQIVINVVNKYHFIFVYIETKKDTIDQLKEFDQQLKKMMQVWKKVIIFIVKFVSFVYCRVI